MSRHHYLIFRRLFALTKSYDIAKVIHPYFSFIAYFIHYIFSYRSLVA